MSTLAEDLVLLTMDVDGESSLVQQGALECAFAGAVLMDLAFANRIDTDLHTLVAIDRTPTDNPALDRVLAEIVARPEAADTRTWIAELTNEADAIREEALAALAQRGILARQDGLLRTRRHALVEDEAKRRTVRQVADVLDSDDIPDPRDIALIALLDACDLFVEVLPDFDVERHRPRIEQLHRLDLIGRDVAGAIADVEHSIIQAVRARSARFRRLLLHLSMLGAGAALATLLLPRIPIPDRLGPGIAELLWFDGVWQQWSGYLLLGLSVAGLAAVLRLKTRLGVRKAETTPVRRPAGSAQRWRLYHLGLGVGCLALLFAHTGFRLGANLHAVLMGCYVGALACGALVGIATGAAPQLRHIGIGPNARRLILRLHVWLLLPLPALLVVHILVVYLY